MLYCSNDSKVIIFCIKKYTTTLFHCPKDLEKSHSLECKVCHCNLGQQN